MSYWDVLRFESGFDEIEPTKLLLTDTFEFTDICRMLQVCNILI